MQGLEVAPVRLATTVIGTGTGSRIAPRPGADLVPDPVRSLSRPAKPDRPARVLGDRLAQSYAGLPEHERPAAVDAVRDAFAAAGELTADRLFAVHLDPERPAAELPPAAGLSDRATGLYGELRAAERMRELVEDVRERVGPRPDAAALDFERRYAEFMAATHCRMGLFGLTPGRSAGE
ncbi:hypothetical protein ACFV8T_26000 [Streptomyces sp. NPDC059832]|uniref:NACHT N-terminal Helical domain 1-containing protein n=1 Tax=unclassified Streptomyces TaxID=2593676 RepID=UPI00366971A3